MKIIPATPTLKDEDTIRFMKQVETKPTAAAIQHNKMLKQIYKCSFDNQNNDGDSLVNKASLEACSQGSRHFSDERFKRIVNGQSDNYLLNKTFHEKMYCYDTSKEKILGLKNCYNILILFFVYDIINVLTKIV